ncbi:hypothetical protein [uncultured Mucilaginibacter sp.]|uniref:hypothetical protein n=1 Tax=uncultured Mucilaginibacter sp. TaxID=797541 RepID=UPI0025EABED5|nr:hypothetical protein [uncultured Mucilaginibacter sp.]
MKAFAIALSLGFFSFNTLAADTTIVKLMQSVAAIDIGRYYTDYYVFRKASEPHLNWFRNDEIQSVISGVRIEDFEKPDTTTMYWPDYHLPGAIYIDSKHIATPAEFKKFMKSLPEVDSKTGEIKAVYKPIRGKQLVGYYVFSKPAFTADKKFALVTIDMEDSGYCYILRNINGNWKVVYRSSWQT